MTFLSIVAATSLVGLISLTGIVFFVTKTNINKLTFYFVSLASGTMLGSAFLHLIPEALEQNTHRTLMAVCGGVFFFFILEKLLVWRHCHSHPFSHDHHRPTAARMVIFGDAIHNFIDGAIIASSFLVSREVGISVTAAILLHEIPQEIGDFGILVHGGYSMKQALGINLITATTAIFGSIITYFFLEAAPFSQTILIPFTAGGFLYIALADLIPQLHEQTTIKETLGQIALLASGFGLMAMFKHSHG